jgi:hypothetical protein
MSADNAARNFRVGDYERAANDWYVEPRWCVEQLADAIDFTGDKILDPCCGMGTIPEVFLDRGRLVRASDLQDRGYIGCIPDLDFLSPSAAIDIDDSTSIVMNPPFKQAEAFVRQALRYAHRRVAIIQQLSFLASMGRNALFTEFPPSDILILSKRPSMPPGHMIAEMGDKAFRGGATDFCWIVWTAPHDRETRVRWLSPQVPA